MTDNLSRLTSLADVADRAGVSVTTASRVLSGSAHPVAATTRARVLEAANELDFEPNLVARGLVMQRTHLVAVFVHDITDEFYGRILRGIEDVAFANGFSTIVCETDCDPDKEIAYVRHARSRRVDAIIYAGSSAADAEKQVELVAQLRSVEAAGAVLLRLAPHATVGPDVSYSTREGFGLLVDHLIELGHREFAYVGAPAALNSTKVARHALAEVLRRHAVEFRPDRIITGDGTRAAGTEAAKQLVERELVYTAVLAATDHAAAGLVAGLRELGVRVPRDVAVVGFGDLTVAGDVGVTTVRVPLYDIGTAAMQRAIWILGGGARPARDNLPLELVVRESSVDQSR